MKKESNIEEKLDKIIKLLNEDKYHCLNCNKYVSNLYPVECGLGTLNFCKECHQKIYYPEKKTNTKKKGFFRSLFG